MFIVVKRNSNVKSHSLEFGLPQINGTHYCCILQQNSTVIFYLFDCSFENVFCFCFVVLKTKET